MTNKEFYKEDILDLVCNGKTIAINKDTKLPCDCDIVNCGKCLLYDDDSHRACRKSFIEWCNAEYVEPCQFEKDELVEVSDDGLQWSLRYFSSMANDHAFKDRRICCFANGKTSKKTSDLTTWRYCRKYGTLGGLTEVAE